jgi:predicted DNA-binding transcriptional regulator AlpA
VTPEQPEQPEPGDALTVADVARLVGLAPSTIRAYVSRSQMPAPSGRLGATPYWTRAQLADWMTSRTGPPPGT